MVGAHEHPTCIIDIICIQRRKKAMNFRLLGYGRAFAVPSRRLETSREKLSRSPEDALRSCYCSSYWLSSSSMKELLCSFSIRSFREAHSCGDRKLVEVGAGARVQFLAGACEAHLGEPAGKLRVLWRCSLKQMKR